MGFAGLQTCLVQRNAQIHDELFVKNVIKNGLNYHSKLNYFIHNKCHFSQSRENGRISSSNCDTEHSFSQKMTYMQLFCLIPTFSVQVKHTIKNRECKNNNFGVYVVILHLRYPRISVTNTARQTWLQAGMKRSTHSVTQRMTLLNKRRGNNKTRYEELWNGLDLCWEVRN